MRKLIALLSLTSLTACGGHSYREADKPSDPTHNTAPEADPFTPIGELQPDGLFVKARASFFYTTGEEPSLSGLMLFKGFLFSTAYAANPATQAVSVVLAPNVTMTMSNVAFATPVMSNAVLSFGHLDITALNDNDLDHCNPGGNSHCGTALFRIYTTGTAAAGFYNAADAFGAPMTAGPTGNLQTVGLNTVGAVTVQSIAVPGSKHTVKLSDFSPAPVYQFSGDFTNAGAGTYTTTINVEFALAP